MYLLEDIAWKADNMSSNNGDYSTCIVSSSGSDTLLLHCLQDFTPMAYLKSSTSVLFIQGIYEKYSFCNPIRINFDRIVYQSIQIVYSFVKLICIYDSRVIYVKDTCTIKIT